MINVLNFWPDSKIKQVQVVVIKKSRSTFYQGNPAIFIRPVVFRPPVTRGLAFHRKTNFNIIRALYANTMQKQIMCKYTLKIQAVKLENL